MSTEPRKVPPEAVGAFLHGSDNGQPPTNGAGEPAIDWPLYDGAEDWTFEIEKN